MNCFEDSLHRALISKRMFIAIALLIIVVSLSGMGSELHRVCVPVVCTVPYTTALLEEYESGFIKSYLPRCSIISYILSKLFACAISGGLAEVIGVYISVQYLLPKGEENEIPVIYYGLLFLTGAVWAIFSSLLCVVTKSRYVAYGGGFVAYYMMVILCERYFPKLYTLNPTEWFMYQHEWVFGQWGIVALLFGISLILICVYYCFARRLIEDV